MTHLQKVFEPGQIGHVDDGRTLLAGLIAARVEPAAECG
jgi:hypothetical protein